MNLLAYFLIIASVGLRILRHFGFINLPPNFSPIAALALFSGVYLDKRQALYIPVAAMFISDIFIGFYNPLIMASVYLCFITAVFIGRYIKNNKGILNTIGGSLSASIIFYLVTNYAVWAFSTLYPANFHGIIQSYVMAIPFFRYTVLGDLFYVTILFGCYETVFYIVKNRRELWPASIK